MDAKKVFGSIKKHEVSGREGSVKRYEVLRGVNFENPYKPHALGPSNDMSFLSPSEHMR